MIRHNRLTKTKECDILQSRSGDEPLIWRSSPIGRDNGLKIRTVWVRIPSPLPQCRTYFHASGKKEEKAEFRPDPITAVTLVKNKTVQYYFFSVPISSLQGIGGMESFRQRAHNAGSLSPRVWGIEKFRPYLNPKRTVRHLGAVPRCSTNPDSMKGIRRGSTPPVGQKVRDSLLISQHVFDGVFREQIRTVRSLSRNGVQRGDNARPLKITHYHNWQ